MFDTWVLYRWAFLCYSAVCGDCCPPKEVALGAKLLSSAALRFLYSLHRKLVVGCGQSIDRGLVVSLGGWPRFVGAVVAGSCAESSKAGSYSGGAVQPCVSIAWEDVSARGFEVEIDRPWRHFGPRLASPCLAPPAALLPTQAAGEEKATAEEGPWRLTLDMPSYLPCMQHLKNREVRRATFRWLRTLTFHDRAPIEILG